MRPRPTAGWHVSHSWPWLVLVAAVLPGCTYHHTVINEKVRRLDLTNLRVGETTWREAMRQLGAPVSANSPERLLEARISEQSLKYVAAETKTVGFDVPIYIGRLPFRWSHVQDTYELLLEFDDQSKLTNVYETRQEVVWRPWAKVPELKPPMTRVILGSDAG